MTTETSRPHVVIVGGGITGLSAAWFLEKESARQNLKVTYSLLDASPRWGGKIESVEIDGYGDDPFTVELGPDSILTRKPAALTLARELGLEGHVIGTNSLPHSTFVLKSGRLLPLPPGLALLVPSSIRPFLRSPLFTPWGKLRMLLEVFIPPRRDESDETMAEFVRRRLGQEALDYLADPLLAGIFNGDSSRLSMQATFPQFPRLEQQHGSLLRGIWANRHMKAPQGVPLVSFRGGIQELVNALARDLTGDLRLESGVTEITPLADGGYQVSLDGERIRADALILTTPAPGAAHLLRTLAPSAAHLLGGIRYSSIGTLALGYRREDIPHPMNAHGVVIPPAERRLIDGISFASSKWPHRAPADYALLRVFFGGPHSEHVMALDDPDLLVAVRAELQSILGIEAEPLFYRPRRWHNAYPQYDLGHLERVAAIERELPAGLYVAGSSYRGIGIPDCVSQGQNAADLALAHVSVTRARERQE